MDLALNNIQWWMCHKTKLNQTWNNNSSWSKKNYI